MIYAASCETGLMVHGWTPASDDSGRLNLTPSLTACAKHSIHKRPSRIHGGACAQRLVDPLRALALNRYGYSLRILAPAEIRIVRKGLLAYVSRHNCWSFNLIKAKYYTGLRENWPPHAQA